MSKLLKDDRIIPTGKDINTRHGCVCKNKYKNQSGKVFKETCNVSTGTAIWCQVKGKCGKPNLKGPLKGTYWDNCDLASRSFIDDTIVFGKNYYLHNMIGISIYIIVFIITIPFILYKTHSHALLEVYLPNFDLLATAVSFSGGPGKYNIFQELYNPQSKNLMGFTSTLIINYLSLLGLTYLVARQVKITKSISKGWSIGLVMLLLTYLVPNDFISAAQHKFATYIYKKTNVNIEQLSTFSPYYFLTVALGLSIAAMFIMLEKLILSHYRWIVDPILKRVFVIEHLLIHR